MALITHSNTTLVKVKLLVTAVFLKLLSNSNTTLVKVKYSSIKEI